MVFAILAFIGFEAAAPMGEEARKPRWTVPRAVIGSCFLIGLFYLFCSYAWVIGTGFPNFTEDTLAQADPHLRQTDRVLAQVVEVPGGRRRGFHRGATSPRSTGAAAGC
jgi:amino acid transporter